MKIKINKAAINKNNNENVGSKPAKKERNLSDNEIE